MENLNLFWERLLSDSQLAWFVGILLVALIVLLGAFLKVIFTADKSEKLAYQRWRNGLWADDYLGQLKETSQETQQAIEALRSEISEREEENIKRLQKAEELEEKITQKQALIEEMEKSNRTPFQLSTFLLGFFIALVLAGLIFAGGLFYNFIALKVL